MFRDTAFYKSLDLFTACSIVEGFSGEHHDAETICICWQWLHDTGHAYRLQGFYGRTAQSLIASGDIVA